MLTKIASDFVQVEGIGKYLLLLNFRESLVKKALWRLIN